MAVKQPQFDLRRGLSGGADVWDAGLAGELLSADYFEAAGGGGSSPVGEAVEIDSASAVTTKLLAAVGAAFEVDTAFALAAAAGAITLPTLPAVEVDVAGQLSAKLTLQITTTSSLETASQLVGKVSTGAGVAEELDTASALPTGGALALPVGLAAEADTAFALTSPYSPPATSGASGGGGGHTGSAVRKHRWEADKELWNASEKKLAKPLPLAPAKQAPVKLRDTAAARALLEKVLAPKAASILPTASIITTIVEDTSESDEELEALVAFALLD